MQRCGQNTAANRKIEDKNIFGQSDQYFLFLRCLTLRFVQLCLIQGQSTNTVDGKCNERGWACTPQPHQPGIILPS
jgi:hypothetical protein